MPAVTIEIRAEPVTGYLQSLPVTASGALDADEERVLLDILQEWLAGA